MASFIRCSCSVSSKLLDSLPDVSIITTSKFSALARLRERVTTGTGSPPRSAAVGTSIDTFARTAHASSCSTAAALNVSHAPSNTVAFSSFLRREAILPIVVVLPIPLAPMTNITVGSEVLENNNPLLVPGGGCSASTRRCLSTGSMSPSCRLSDLAYCRRSAIMPFVVVAPMSACSSTSSRASRRFFMSLFSSNAPAMPPSRRSRERARPSVSLRRFSESIFWRVRRYSTLSPKASPSFPCAVFLAMFCTCAMPSSDRFLKKSNTMLSWVWVRVEGRGCRAYEGNA
mmetsp:Transcript_11884/g.26416  ORF Transcript_11884/g.26416 Transcript_11884/m.26416 type:complete len:287 (-) Transcript_11884:191-1051(-)